MTLMWDIRSSSEKVLFTIRFFLVLDGFLPNRYVGIKVRLRWSDVCQKGVVSLVRSRAVVGRYQPLGRWFGNPRGSAEP